MNSSISKVLSCLIFLFTCSIFGCSTTTVKDSDYKNAFLKTNHFVSLYGQIVSKDDTAYLEYLNKRLMTEKTKALNPELEFKIVLLNSSKPMAFSAGAGYLLISKGLVLTLQNEAELAFVVAHEMSHHYLRHQIDKDNAGEESFFEESEELELEADQLAVGIIAMAGYDPYLAGNALKNTYSGAKLHYLDIKGYPDLETRVTAIYQQVKSSGWKPPGTSDRRDFQSFKRRLRNT